jgi:GH35 family endo-1,4-beta-xylanase
LPWGNTLGRILNFEIEKLDRSLEISHLKTWGINRRYSWLYSIRLYKEIKRLTS